MELRRLIADIRKSDAPLPIDEKSLFVGEGLAGNIPVCPAYMQSAHD